MNSDQEKGLILLVDDEDLILRSLEMAFKIAGYNVITASNGNKAIEIFKQKSKEIRNIILDKSMPDLDGVQTLKQLREIDNNCQVIMMSGYFSQQDEVTLKEDGVVKLFNKPFSIHDMVHSIESLH